MSNYYHPRQKAPHRYLGNGRFENTHPYPSNANTSGHVTRNENLRGSSQLDLALTNISRLSTTDTSNSGETTRPVPSLVRPKPNQSWKGKCLKLIKSMLELEEAKLFREPLNAEKYPFYYELVPKPIDLSEIVRRFRSGYYHAPHEFASDVRRMFDNFKRIFKNPDSPVYAQTNKVSWWFESEYQRILNTLPKNTPSPAAATPRASAVTTPHASTTAATPRATATTPVSAPVTTQPSSLPRSTQNNTGSNVSARVGNVSVGNAPSASESSSSLTTQPSRVVVFGTSAPSVVPATTTSQSTTASHKRKRTGSVAPSNNRGSSGSPRRSSASETAMDVESPGGRSEDTEPELEMQIQVSNIWFGRLRTRPQEPMLLSEKGFTMRLTKNGAVESFHVACDEIVRCMAHLGRNRKQTLFLFVLPSCMKRLETFNPRYTNCSLIAIFATKLVTDQISKLLHIFWLMNRASLFSPVFSEIDQKGALLLLSNIRPEIMQQTNDLIQNMMTGAGATVSTPSHSVATPGHSVATPGQSVVTPGQSGHTEVSENSTRSVTSVEVTISSSSPVVSAVMSTTSHQRVDSVDSRRVSTMTNSDASMTSVVSSSATPVCSLLPRAEVVSIQPTPTITSVGMPVVSSNSHAFTHSLHSVLDGHRLFQAECHRRLLSVNSALVPPPIWTPTTPRTVIAAFTPLRTDSETTAQDMSIGHLQQSPVCIEEDDDDLDLQIIDELLTDSNDTVTHTPFGVTSGDDLMMMSECKSTRCPITQMIMQHPMKNIHCGHSYDLQGVRELIKQRAGKAKCPVYGCSNVLPLRMEDMKLDEERWRLIQDKKP